MSEDVDAQLAALEKAAPDTPDEPATPNEPVETKQTELKREAAPEGEPQRPPLTVEELTQRHEQVKIALREERQQRRAEAAKVREAIAQQERMEKAFQAIQARLAQPQQQTDPNAPFTYEDAVTEMWQERQETQAQRQQREQQEAYQRQQQEAFSRQYTELQSAMVDAEADFRETAPDYDDATTHLTTVWDQQFEAMGYGPDDRRAIIENLSINAVQVALRAGRDPAKAVYEAAQKAGYQRKNGAPPNGAQPAGAGAERLAQMKAGQAASASMSGGGSSAQGGEMTLARIATLEGAAFDAAFDKFLKGAR